MASGSKLKIVALISGGKDSLFSILHCLANGHEVVALGNLYPDNVSYNDQGQQLENEQDADSYMFQTVGHSVIDLYAKALALPLYRRPLTGRAVDDSLNYTPAGTPVAQSDEAEDLRLLLQDVVKEHPGVNAVSTGAILSTYQRMRVESVAIRLNLVPLSYLWQYPYLHPHRNASLLEDMNNVGMDSRLVKVASGGLDESFLGTSVNDPATIRRMQQRMKRFNPAVGAVLGEGGEFETLAVVGPLPLWQKQIVIAKSSVKSDAGGSCSLLVQTADIRDYSKEITRNHIESLRVPALLDAEFQQLLKHQIVVSGLPCEAPASSLRQTIDFPRFAGSLSASQLSTCQLRPQSYTFRGHGPTSLAQMEDIVNHVDSALGRLIVDTTLLLRDMADFQTVNSAYARLFTTVLPPARVTIAVGDLLPKGCNVILIARIFANNTERRGLHVQSRSYWAPANIGPYSQAISEPILKFEDEHPRLSTSSIVHIAGQIPLVPASMNSPDEQYIKSLMSDTAPEKWKNVLIDASVALALQHLWRIGRETQVKAWTGGIVYVNGQLDDSSRDLVVSTALSQWQDIHSYWQGRQLGTNGQSEEEEAEAEDTRAKLPDMTVFQDDTANAIPPCFAVLVADLPRGVPVEWWSLGLSSNKVRQQLDDHDELKGFHTTCLTSQVTFTCIAFMQDRVADVQRFMAGCDIETTSIMAFASCTLPQCLLVFKVQLVPVFAIWNDRGQLADWLLMITQYSSHTTL